MAVPGARGQATNETSQSKNQDTAQLATDARVPAEDATVGPGDLLHIDVFDIPELSRDVRVSPSGDISFPLIPDRIPAAGRSPYQLEEALEQALSSGGFVSHPQVSVFVRELNSQPVSVVGAVAHPTVLQVVRPMSLLEVLASAGGVTDDAGPDIVITRTVHPYDPHVQTVSDNADTVQNGTQTTITIRVQDLLQSGKPEFNIPVLGGDVVTVPRAGIVYVMGAGVAQQGEYVMQGHGEQVTVLKAVALAHGLTGFAKANDSMLLRNDPTTGKRDSIRIRLKDIQNHKIDDVPMLSNDILLVPDSRGKKALARGAEAAVGVGSQIAVYRMP